MDSLLRRKPSHESEFVQGLDVKWSLGRGAEANVLFLAEKLWSRKPALLMQTEVENTATLNWKS